MPAEGCGGKREQGRHQYVAALQQCSHWISPVQRSRRSLPETRRRNRGRSDRSRCRICPDRMLELGARSQSVSYETVGACDHCVHPAGPRNRVMRLCTVAQNRREDNETRPPATVRREAGRGPATAWPTGGGRSPLLATCNKLPSGGYLNLRVGTRMPSWRPVASETLQPSPASRGSSPF